ncbi:MAG: biotin/lipoyl-binding protein [Clostridia bacterium]|jgi:biotin carboxyl carrier protein|nr:biotin/lipoyl-binding protein [Clostridia bacterium]
MIYKVSLNGKIYEVEVEKGEAVIKAEFDAALPTVSVSEAAFAPQAPAASAAPAPVAASSAQATAGSTVVTAPMNGNINAIKVTTGQTVKEGDVVMILEAMKMENDIPASKSGKIGQIFVQKGATVDTGAQLFEIL